MVTCELCGKEVKTTQGLRGHKTFQHGVTANSTQQSVARVATEQQVSLLEERLSKLEYITGLRESDWDDLLSNTQPFTDRLINITEQLSKLSDTVSKLSEDVGLAKVDKVMVGELNQKLKEAHDRLGAVMNNHLEIFNKNFEVHQSRIDKAQKMIKDLGEGLGVVKTRLDNHGHDGLKVIPEMVVKVANLQ
jgi:chromosome segregation ATPase